MTNEGQSVIMMVLAHEAQNRIREIGPSKACRVLAHNDTGSGFSVFGGQMKEILLSKGYVTVVDDEDYAELTQHKWCVINDAPPRMYAMRAERMPNGTRRYLLMHRVIMQVPKGLCVDHINGDPLDNRRENLRICTVSQNLMNQRIQKRAKSSRHKGVSWNKLRNKWYAKIKQDGQSYHLGVFDDEDDAARVYNAAAIERFGEFALLNEITGG